MHLRFHDIFLPFVITAVERRCAEKKARTFNQMYHPVMKAHFSPFYFISFINENRLFPADIVPPGDTSFKVSLSPWANYTFRVIARNKVGNSEPSNVWSLCTTPPDVPFKNPDNVEGRGTSPTNLVISWTVRN